MPCSYRIYKDRRLIVTVVSGEIKFAECVTLDDGLHNDPDFDATFAHLVDATRVIRADLSAAELRSLAGRTKFSPQARMAIVSTSTVLFGLGRMYEAYLRLSGSAEFIAVFKEMDEARQWLNIDGEFYAHAP